MRVKKIAAVCKEQKLAELWDAVDADGVVRQWISCGPGIYPVDGMPALRGEHLPSLLSLSKKEQEKMELKTGAKPEGLDLSDVSPGEKISMQASFLVKCGGRAFWPLMAGGKTYFIDTALLVPIAAEYQSAELYLRKVGETPFFAVKNGLICVGAVFPEPDMGQLARELSVVGDGYEET